MQQEQHPLISAMAGRYKLISFYASGGFADIYLAQNIYTRETAAVKVLKFSLLQREDLQKLFQREVFTAEKFSHTNRHVPE